MNLTRWVMALRRLLGVRWSYAAAVKLARGGRRIRCATPQAGPWLKLINDREYLDETGCTTPVSVYHFDYEWEVEPDAGGAA